MKMLRIVDYSFFTGIELVELCNPEISLTSNTYVPESVCLWLQCQMLMPEILTLPKNPQYMILCICLFLSLI